MKYYLISIVIFVSVLSFGQNSDFESKPEKEEQSKIRLNPFFSYDFNLSNDTYRHNNGITYFTYEKVNYRLGVDVDYFLKKNISISTGVNYSNKDYESLYDCESCFSPFFQNIKLQFIDLPIYGGYYMDFNKLNIFGQIGIVNHFTIKREVHFSDQEVTLENIKKYYLSGKIGLGVSYPITNRHHLFVVTDYITGVTGIFENEDYKLKTLGIRMGIQFLL